MTNPITGEKDDDDKKLRPDEPLDFGRRIATPGATEPKTGIVGALGEVASGAILRPLTELGAILEPDIVDDTTRKKVASLSDGVTRSFEDMTLFGQLTSGYWETSKPDPDFKLTEELIGDLMKDLPSDYLREYYGARSLEEALATRERLLRQADNLRTLGGDYTLGGRLLIGLSVGIADPFMLAADFATFGAARSAGVAYGLARAGLGGRLALASEAGLAVGLSSAAYEAILTTRDANTDTTNVVLAGIAGLGLGGALSFALTPSAYARAIDDAVTGGSVARAEKAAEDYALATLAEDAEANGARLTEAGRRTVNATKSDEPLIPREEFIEGLGREFDDELETAAALLRAGDETTPDELRAATDRVIDAAVRYRQAGGEGAYISSRIDDAMAREIDTRMRAVQAEVDKMGRESDFTETMRAEAEARIERLEKLVKDLRFVVEADERLPILRKKTEDIRAARKARALKERGDTRAEAEARMTAALERQGRLAKLNIEREAKGLPPLDKLPGDEAPVVPKAKPLSKEMQELTKAERDASFEISQIGPKRGDIVRFYTTENNPDRGLFENPAKSLAVLEKELADIRAQLEAPSSVERVAMSKEAAKAYAKLLTDLEILRMRVMGELDVVSFNVDEMVPGGIEGFAARHLDEQDIVDAAKKADPEDGGDGIGAMWAGLTVQHQTQLRNTTTADLRRDFAEQHMQGFTPVFRRVRFGLAAWGKDPNKRHPLTRLWMNYAVHDPLMQKHAVTGEFIPNPFAATERVALEMSTYLGPFKTRYNINLHKWLDENKSWRDLGKISEGSEYFANEVSHAVRNKPGTYTQDPHINAAADEFRKFAAELLAYAKANRLRGFENVLEEATYFPRLLASDKIDAMILTYGELAVKKLIRKSLVRGSQNWTWTPNPDEFDAMAKAYFEGARGSTNSLADLQRVFSLGDLERLEPLLSSAGVPRTDIDDILRRLQDAKQRANANAGKIARGKHRTRLDELTEDHALNLETRKWEKIKFVDLLENNTEHVTGKYARDIIGAVEHQRLMSMVGLNKKGDPIDIETLFQNMRSTRDPALHSADALEQEIKSLRMISNLIRGIPNWQEGLSTDIARLIKDYNFVRVLGQVGFAQTAELAQQMGELGISTYMRSIPKMGSLIRDAKSGDFDDLFTQQMDMLTGMFTERSARNYSQHMGDLSYDASRSLKMAKAISNQASNIQSDLSGMAPLNAFGRRVGAIGLATELVHAAKGIRVGPNATPVRLADMGLDNAMAARVYKLLEKAQLNQHGNIVDLNITHWNDPEAMAAFRLAMNRRVNTMIQTVDIGTQPLFMNHPWWSAFMQFRGFSINAWEKQTLRNINLRDRVAIMGVAASLFGSMLSYIAQTHVRSIGMTGRERDEYLERRLSTEAIAAATFARIGFASLIPGVIDTGVALTGNKGFFSHARTSGLASDLVMGSPLMDLLSTAERGLIRGPLASLVNSDYDFSKSDARAFQRALPFQNFIGATIFFNTLNTLSDLPDKSR